MNLQINLFSEDKLINKSERRFSLIRGYDFLISNSISKDIILNYAFNSRDEIYSSTIKYGLSNERNYNYFLGAIIDTHFNLEAMNVSRKSKGFVVVYSINKLLPIILNIICKSSIEKVSSIDGIDDISDSILNLDFSKDLYINSLINVDNNLDDYLNSILLSGDSEVDQLKRLVSEINVVALNILKYIISHLETYSSLVVLSVDKSRILLSSSEPSVSCLEVSFNGFSYRLNPLVTNELNGFYKTKDSFNFCEVVA